MHATYTFLIDGPSDTGPVSDDEFKKHAESCISSYIERHGDENNWYTSIMLVTSDGRIILMADEPHLKRELEDPNHWLVKLPADQRFDAVRRFALGCVAIDMELRGARAFMFQNDEARKLEDLSFDELDKAIETDTPAWLAKQYQALAKNDTPEEAYPGQASYLRRKISREFEMYHDAAYKPFADYGDSPYKYRCYDIRDNNCGNAEIDDQVAFVLVDIHT